ncbi:MAG TPA: alpha/beta hydrolase [Gammaproteobacteria bacterium]|nr:alpha/beta hydrolase [Gammaproteobacteria bacterium]
MKLTFKSIRLISLLFLFLIFTIEKCYADMPGVSCQSTCPETPPPFKSNQPFPLGAHCTRLKQNTIYYRTAGENNPTLIFSSGTGFPSDGWYESNIANQISKKVRVFSYDRVFTFNSCPNPNNYMPITAQDVVTQLHQLLKQENIKPPYILVGQSIGGLYMLLYAREFPQEVAGLVLMDASTDNGPTPLPKEAKPILKKMGNPENPLPDNPLYNEIIGQLPSYLQMRNAPPLPNDMPLIVMYATKHCLPSAWTKKLMCMTAKQEENHKAHQVEMFNMTSVHQLIQVNGDHMSFFTKEQNPVVMNALNEILIMAQPRLKNHHE